MGLDTTHGAWHGAYSAFNTWRTQIAKCLGIPLDLMEGFYTANSQQSGFSNPLTLVELVVKRDGIALEQFNRPIEQFPLLWDAFRPSPLHELLYHSDCDGEIEWKKCKKIADALESLLPELHEQDFGGHVGPIREATKTFIAGLRLAYKKKENLEFH